MDLSAKRSVSLQAYTGEAFAPLVGAFVENAAAAFSMGKKEAFDLVTAANGVFTHICRFVLKNSEKIEIRCTGGGYHVDVEFIFPAADIDLRGFNLTAGTLSADDSGPEEVGLMLASRLVDRCAVSQVEGRGLKLTLLKEKAYPLFEETSLALPAPLDEFSIRPPGPEELKLFARLVKTCYRDQILPEFFDYPGKVVDMAAGAHYEAAVAVGPAGEIGGGLFWHYAGKRVVECYGPYLFNQKAGTAMANALIDSCISTIARTEVVVLINRFATPELPREYFEFLGGARFRLNGTELWRQSWFRLLHEDLGSVAWVHPELEDFLSKEYDRLVLPREIRHVTPAGERHARHSVLSTHFEHSEATATLRPMMFGTDFEQNLAQHLQLLRQEGILNIFFYLDVGKSGQAAFTPGLLQHDFQPCVVFPCSGVGDVVLFQFQGASA